MKKPVVFVVSDSGHDFSSAEQRGEIQYIFDGKVNVFASDQMCREIVDKLQGSTEDDYLVPSGNALAACVAFSTLMEKHGKVNALIYSFKHSVYEVRTVRSKQLVGEREEE